MGFTVYYRSTDAVDQPKADVIGRAAAELCKGRSWLHCEPVHFYARPNDGHLFGGSKPNFSPHHADAESAGHSGLPDGTTRDMLGVLAQLSRDQGVDWEISHDHSEGPVGFIRGGVWDEAVLTHIEAFSDLADGLLEELEDLGENGFVA